MSLKLLLLFIVCVRCLSLLLLLVDAVLGVCVHVWGKSQLAIAQLRQLTQVVAVATQFLAPAIAIIVIVGVVVVVVVVVVSVSVIFVIVTVAVCWFVVNCWLLRAAVLTPTTTVDGNI